MFCFSDKQLTFDKNGLFFQQDTVEILEVPDIPQNKVKVSMKLQRIGEYPLREVLEAYQVLML